MYVISSPRLIRGYSLPIEYSLQASPIGAYSVKQGAESTDVPKNIPMMFSWLNYRLGLRWQIWVSPRIPKVFHYGVKRACISVQGRQTSSGTATATICTQVVRCPKWVGWICTWCLLRAESNWTQEKIFLVPRFSLKSFSSKNLQVVSAQNSLICTVSSHVQYPSIRGMNVMTSKLRLATNGALHIYPQIIISHIPNRNTKLASLLLKTQASSLELPSANPTIWKRIKLDL